LLTTAVGLAYVLQRLAFPVLYAGWQQAVWYQLEVKRDFGIGMFFALERLTHLLGGVKDRYLLLVHIALLAGILLFLYRRRALRYQGDTISRIWLSLVLLTALLANPRLQGYDSVVAMLPAAYLFGKMAWMQPKGPRRWGMIAVPVLLVLIAFVKISVGTLIFLVTAEALGLGLVYKADVRRRDVSHRDSLVVVGATR